MRTGHPAAAHPAPYDPAVRTPPSAIPTGGSETRSAALLWAAAAALLAAHAILAWMGRAPGVTLGNDDAMYVQLAQSLRDFGYRDLYYVGSPPHVKYPPGYPALLALVSLVTGMRMDAFIVVGILCSVAALALMFDVVRRRWSPALAILFLAVTTLNPRLVLYAGRLMSESPFMLWLALALWALARDRVGGPSRRDLVLAGAAAIMAALTRSIGVAVVGGLFLLWIGERRWRAAGALAVAAAATVGAWMLRTLSLGGGLTGESYLADTFLHSAKADAGVAVPGPLVRLVRRPLAHAVDYLTRLVPSQTPFPSVPGTTIDNLLLVALIVTLGGVGLWQIWRRWRPAIPVLACYFGICFIWPWPISRFITPVLPLIHQALLAGAGTMGARFLRRGWIVPAGLAAIIVATALPADLEAARQGLACDRRDPQRSAACYSDDEREFFGIIRDVAATAPPGAVFVTMKEGPFGYYTGHQTVPILRVLRSTPESVLGAIDEAGARYVVLSRIRPTSELQLAGLLAPHCDRLELVRAYAPTSYLFRIRQDAGDGAGACEAIERYQAAVEALLASPEGG